jgi:Tfp pilus assembly protein PilO
MLHQVKKGVWEHIMNLAIKTIHMTYDTRTATKYIHELDIRIRMVPRYSGLKKFDKGISELSFITANEFQQFMRVSILVREYIS